MQNGDRSHFVKILSACLDTYGRERSDTVMALWWRLLAPYSLDDVVDALSAHMRTSKYAPVPAEIISALTEHDGRPTADEAWAMIPRSEYDSVFWTEEMSKAYGIAAPLLEHGDQVAARRAFIDRYEALVSEARSKGVSVNVTPSFGFDVGGREAAIQKALERGMISNEKAISYSSQRSTENAITYDAVKMIQ